MTVLSRQVVAEQAPMYLVGLGHGAIHWTAAVFYMLLPFIAKSFDLSYTQAGLAVSVLHLTTTLTNFVSGPTVDISGRRGSGQVAALLVSVAALALFPIANVFSVLLVLVVVMAVANNFWHPAAISYLSLRYPERRGYALSIHALGANLGDATAPLAIGALLLLVDWRTGAAISALPVLTVAAAVGWLAWRDRSVNGGGAAGRATAASAPAPTLGGYLKQAVGAFREPAVLTLSLAAGLRSVTQNGLIAFLPLYIADVLGAGPVLLGLSLSAFQASGMFGAPAAGIISDRKGRKPVAVLALAAAAAFAFLLPALPVGLGFIAGAACLGFCLFAVRPVIHSWMLDMTPPELGGSATSVLFGIQGGFSILTPVLGGILADAYGLPTALVVFAAFCAAAAAVTAMVPPARGG